MNVRLVPCVLLLAASASLLVGCKKEPTRWNLAVRLPVVEDSLTWDDVLTLGEAGTLEDRLLPIEAALAHLPQVEATADGARKIAVGNPGAVLNSAEGEVWASHNGRALGLGQVRFGMFHPARVFVTEGA